MNNHAIVAYVGNPNIFSCFADPFDQLFEVIESWCIYDIIYQFQNFPIPKIFGLPLRKSLRTPMDQVCLKIRVDGARKLKEVGAL